MKKIITLIIILLGALLIKIPPYVELNNLAIIEAIGVMHTDKYTIYLKEVIPTKDENGIKYEYKYYKSSSFSLEDAYDKLNRNIKKKLYYKDTSYIVLNMEKSNKVKKIFSINPKKIIHTKNVYKKLKSL